MLKYEIKDRFTGKIKFTAEIECPENAPPSMKLGLAIKWGIKAGANLADADLAGANLAGANLADTNLIDGGQRSDGYRFVGWIKDGHLWIIAGCRNFNLPESRDHWTKTRTGTPLGDETFAILDHIEKVATIRGMIDGAVGWGDEYGKLGGETA